MERSAVVTLKKTPLTARHRSLGARMVEFGGWEMPLEYSGIGHEHLAVRQRAGLFDVSHMGQIEVAGRDALSAVQHITSNDASKLRVGQAHYSALTTPEGTFVDDVLVYRLALDHFMFVVNASNIEKDCRWIADHIKTAGDAMAVNASARYALLALQGPRSRQVLQPLTGIPLDEIRYYWFAHGEVAGVRATISRTGYTGEDGFEIFTAPQSAPLLWDTLLEQGKNAEMVPAGLGARDTLRLEAAMRLYGQDIDETTTILEADLGWIVAWDKGDFIGADALRHQRERGVARRLVGFEVEGRGIARHGFEIYADGRRMGTVTSGTQTPFLKKAIGFAYLPVEEATAGRRFEIDIRGKRIPAKVVHLPFYKRPK